MKIIYMNSTLNMMAAINREFVENLVKTGEVKEIEQTRYLVIYVNE
jgi:hypothetical protein